jgi:hypothetical protein
MMREILQFDMWLVASLILLFNHVLDELDEKYAPGQSRKICFFNALPFSYFLELVRCATQHHMYPVTLVPNTV